MAKQIIHLTEAELRDIVSESVEEIMLSEGLFNRNNNNANNNGQMIQREKPGFLKRLGTKMSAAMEAGAAANPNNRFMSSGINLARKLGGNRTTYYSRNDNSLDSYAQRRGYKGGRKFTKRDEQELDDFMRKRGYSK